MSITVSQSEVYSSYKRSRALSDSKQAGETVKTSKNHNPSSLEARFCRFSWVLSNRAYLTPGIPGAVWESRETAELGSWRHAALFHCAQGVFH